MKKNQKLHIGKSKYSLSRPKMCGHRSKGYPELAFDETKVHQGAQVEFEHTCDGEHAERIAMDHIAEMGYQYYPELLKLERKLKKLKQDMPDKRFPHKPIKAKFRSKIKK
jgi:hypothetical protein